jgi:hypothetical protein
MVALNTVYSGDWSGAKIERQTIGLGPAWLHLTANGVTCLLGNLAPPIFPFASAWNRLVDAITPVSLKALFAKHGFEPSAANFHLPEIQVEESAGVGFGVMMLLGLSLVAACWWRRGRDKQAGPSGDLVTRLVCIAPWISLLFLMAKLNLSGVTRYLAPYYPLLSMGLLLSPAQAGLTRRGWWRSCALFSCGLALLLVVISPARPLWPAGWFVEQYGLRLRSNKLAARGLAAYEAKSRRAEVFAPLIALLPPDASPLGYAADDFPETSLWKPFGSRRILHVRLSDSAEDMRRRGIKYVLLTSDRLKEPWAEWLQRQDARELHAVTLKMWGSLPPFVWHLVELNPKS